MTEAKFLLSRKKLIEQYEKLKELGLKVSYSYKTNSQIGKVIQKTPELSEIEFSIHSNEEFSDFPTEQLDRVWFFTQAESVEELQDLIKKGIKKFVIDNPVDLDRILEAIEKIEDKKTKIKLSLRMKFQEHRIGSGKYFVYGMSSDKVNSLISEERLSKNPCISELGIHIHRKTQNTSEWEILEELQDSLQEETVKNISFLNLGGGLPVKYRSYSNTLEKTQEYIFSKIKEAKDWLDKKEIKTYIEPGRFLAAPAVKIETEIIQVYDKKIIINVSVYNCAIDNVLTNTKMLLEEEVSEDNKNSEDYLIKGNSPTRDDIFRYKVKLPKEKAKVGKKLTFLNAGAYNYTTDFFGYKKLPTIIVD